MKVMDVSMEIFPRSYSTYSDDDGIQFFQQLEESGLEYKLLRELSITIFGDKTESKKWTVYNVKTLETINYILVFNQTGNTIISMRYNVGDRQMEKALKNVMENLSDWY